MVDFDITFLGTCAYDFNERLYTDLEFKFDKDARRASSALINGKYLIDCGMFVLNSLEINKTNLADITDIFLTHTHGDHYNLDAIKKIASSKKAPLNLWVRGDAVIPEIDNVNVIKMEKQREYVVDDMTVTSLSCNHEEAFFPRWLLFRKNGKSFLYALDGAWFMMDTYYYLKDMKLDLMVLDATSGEIVDEYRIAEHNDLPMIRLILPSLKKWGIMGENTMVYLSHLAPSLHKPHDETEKIANSFGAHIAFDGLELKI